MAVKNSVKAIALTSFNAAALNGNYQPINVNGLEGACFLLRINNGGSTIITISYDGVHDHEAVLANTPCHLNFQTNAQPNTSIALFPKGTIIYVKGTAGIGTIYLSGYYQSGS